MLKVVRYGSEMSWSFVSTTGHRCDESSFNGNYDHWRSCLLKPGTYTIYCIDSYGDGWHGGYITIQNTRYCDNFCPDPPYCNGQSEWDPTTNTGGGALYVQKDIEIREGSIQCKVKADTLIFVFLSYSKLC